MAGFGVADDPGVHVGGASGIGSGSPWGGDGRAGAVFGVGGGAVNIWLWLVLLVPPGIMVVAPFVIWFLT